MSQNQTQTTYIPKFAFPFKDVNNINTYNEKLSSTPKGNYLFTRHGLWHGAPHFYGTNFDSKIQVIADGELVAYRLNSKYLKNSDAQEGKGAYSTGFFLVRHKLEYPTNNKLIFFSLYMHTAKKDAYNIIQNQTNQSNTTNYYTVKKGDTLGKIAKVHNTTVDKLRQDNNIADVNKIREGHVLIIKPFPSSQPTQNTPPPQTNPNSNPNFIVENPLFDEVVVLPTPIKIKAGEVIGLMGEYNQQKESDNKVLHLEVFANEEFNTFVQTAQRGDTNLPQSFNWARVIEIDSKDNVSIFEDLEDSVLPLDKDQTDDEIKINKSFRDLFNLIDKDHQNGIQPQEIEKTAEDIEIKKVTNNYIVKHSSEWDKTENMAEKLYKIMDKNQDKIDDVESLKKHYENEKERIYNLSFFAECKDKIEGFPKKDKVYVMNPVGLVNQFVLENDCQSKFKKISKIVLKNEGGFVDSGSDIGGATNHGIAWNTWQTYAQSDLGLAPTRENLEILSEENAEKIYFKRYWEPKGFCKIKDIKVALMIYDWSITSGGAIKEIQKLLNSSKYNANLVLDGSMGNKTIETINSVVDQNLLFNDIGTIRKKYYYDLAFNSDGSHRVIMGKDQALNYNGWINRVNIVLGVQL